ncbi:MAG: ribonuclease P protein component 1 [Fervidobacterium sp.]
MPITPQNLVRHELIGLKVKIASSTNPSLIGLEGTVIDETYNTIKIETNGKDKKEKIVPKQGTIFIFHLPNGKKVEVDGKVLISRPEDRIKKKLPRW